MKLDSIYFLSIGLWALAGISSLSLARYRAIQSVEAAGYYVTNISFVPHVSQGSLSYQFEVNPITPDYEERGEIYLMPTSSVIITYMKKS